VVELKLRFHLFWRILFTIGLFFILQNKIARLSASEWDYASIPFRDRIFLPATIALVLLANLVQLTLTREGHYGALSIGWGEKATFTIFRSRIRLWKDCIVQMDFPWPLNGLNIMEGQMTLPVITRGLISRHKDACLYIFRYGVSAKIEPKAAEYLRKVARKNADHPILVDHSAEPSDPNP
jgi:hypothetical protein